MGNRLAHGLLLAAVASFLLFAGLGSSKLWDRDEPRNAGCAREMLARGDWVTPVFNGELRIHKPVLVYWLIMIAYQWWGINEWSARFWSAALSVGTVLCTWRMGRHCFGPGSGVWSALVLVTALMFQVSGRAATPDAPLIFLATLATTIYVVTALPRFDGQTSPLADPQRIHYPRWPVVALIYLLLGAAVLAKGPVGLVLPTAVIGMFLLIERLPERGRAEGTGRRWLTWLRPFAPGHFLRTCWSMRPVTALLCALAVALPWYTLVWLRTDGQWVKGFLLVHNVTRALQPMENHGGGIWFYPVALLAGFFPWSVLAVPVAWTVARNLKGDTAQAKGLRLAVCWVGVYVGLFSLARTKLPSYITPCYPALALMTGWVMDRWATGQMEGAVRRWIGAACVVLAVAGVAMGVGLWWAADRYVPEERWLAGAGAIPLLGGLVTLAMLTGWKHRLAPWSAAATLWASAAALVLAVFAVGAPAVSRHQQIDRLLAALPDSDAPVGWLGPLEPSWVFYAGKPLVPLRLSDWAASPGPMESTRPHTSDTPPHVPLTRDPVPLQGFCRQGDYYVITTGRLAPQVRAARPELHVLAEVPYFLKNETLVLLGPATMQSARQTPVRENPNNLRRR